MKRLSVLPRKGKRMPERVQNSGNATNGCEPRQNSHGRREPMKSVELAFEDFLRTLSPLRVRLERPHMPPSEVRARQYQEQTHLLLDALRSGSRVRLEAAVFALEIAA